MSVCWNIDKFTSTKSLRFDANNLVPLDKRHIHNCYMVKLKSIRYNTWLQNIFIFVCSLLHEQNNICFYVSKGVEKKWSWKSCKYSLTCTFTYTNTRKYTHIKCLWRELAFCCGRYSGAQRYLCNQCVPLPMHQKCNGQSCWEKKKN